MTVIQEYQAGRAMTGEEYKMSVSRHHDAWLWIGTLQAKLGRRDWVK